MKSVALIKRQTLNKAQYSAKIFAARSREYKVCCFKAAGYKCQAALEYMLIVGIILASLTPLMLYVFQQTEISTRMQQAEVAVNTIAAKADNLYAQGPGAKSTINVLFPSGYGGGTVSGRTVAIKVFLTNAYSDVVAVSKANLTGSLPNEPGYKQIVLETLLSGVVNVSR